MNTVVIGFYGATLDKGKTAGRWDRWRPSVALCRHEDLLIHRFELLHATAHATDAAQVAEDIRQMSPETEVVLRPLDVHDAWDFESMFAALHDLARTYPFDTERDRYLIHITTGTHVAQICWYLLTESRHFPAELVQSIPPQRKRASHDPGAYQVIDLDLSRYDQLARRFVRERAEGASLLKSGIDTQNAAFNALIADIEKVAVASREPMLLTGPTGAGKTHLARQIHALRKARGLTRGELVEVNCATLVGDGAMSALFGHTRGAYTGAVRDRAGLLRSADDGILFLDEIGELGLDEQAMLLRAIEDKRFLPVGTDREVSSDFQLIAGTNRDLLARSASGRFRRDLLARLDVWAFELPALSERREDIAPNLAFEMERASQKLGRKISINREARDLFLRFAEAPDTAWTGNFRDLNAAVLRMATLAPSGRIDEDTVRGEMRRLRRSWGQVAAASSTRLLQALLPDANERLDPFDSVQLEEVVRVCLASESLSDAGRTLFAYSRTQRKTKNDADRLRKYLARFDLSFTQVKSLARLSGARAQPPV